jgi:FKBP12-rapamycin complex-associated protein
VEALIHINNQLRQPEAAVGVLVYAQKHLHMELKESWYEKLCRWDDALSAYERKLSLSPPASADYATALLGKMRCLASLAEWDQLAALCRSEWRKSEPHMRKEMAVIAAHAAWHMGAWDEMAVYVDSVDASGGGGSGAWADTPPALGGVGGASAATGAFLRSVLCIRSGVFPAAQAHIERARGACVDGGLGREGCERGGRKERVAHTIWRTVDVWKICDLCSVIDPAACASKQSSAA